MRSQDKGASTSPGGYHTKASIRVPRSSADGGVGSFDAVKLVQVSLQHANFRHASIEGNHFQHNAWRILAFCRDRISVDEAHHALAPGGSG